MWGSLRFLGLPVSQTLFGLFMLFQVVWTFLSPHVLASKLQVEIPVFMLLGMGSLFAGVCFYRQRKKMPFVGAGMLSLGFLLWGVYLITYPISQAFQDLYRVGFFVAAVLQLFIAVSMIVLVMEEVRYHAEQLRAEAVRVRSEKEALQLKVITAEEQCKSLFDRVRISEGLQEAYNELRSTQQAVVQQERLRALGQMASGIAHDINNALSPIVAYSDMLMAKTADLPESSRRFLGIIRQSGEDISGKQGVELFRSAQPTAGRYEAVITDLGMPDFDGNKVAEAIKAISPTTPIIMMTGWGALMKSEGEKAPDIDALVSKPPRIAELNRLLLQLTLPAVAEVSLPKT
jgi:CheY-like chemotaxis protein